MHRAKVDMRALAKFLLVALSLTFAVVDARETFTEEVLVERLKDDAVAFVFSFVQKSPVSARHRAITSKTLSSIANESGFEELELWFGRGRWNARRWGAPPVTAKPIGAEVWATWAKNKTRDADASQVDPSLGGWKKAVKSLGGVFCASLSTLAESSALTQPVLAFQEWDGAKTAHARVDADVVVKHASLPHESVCVENLAPWLKQLPCRDRSGIGKVLATAHAVFGARHLTFGLRLSKTNTEIISEQTLMMVVPTGDRACGDIMESIAHSRNDACPAADDSYVHVRDGERLKTLGALKGRDQLEAMTRGVNHRKPIVYVERFLTGNGNENGGIIIDVERTKGDLNEPIRIRLFQPLPWFVKLFMHTLRIQHDGRDVSRDATEGIKFVPAIDRIRSSTLELQAVIPANVSTLRLYMQYDKGFLRQSEFPADANRGFDLPPAKMDAFTIRPIAEVTSEAKQTPLTLSLGKGAGPTETVYMNGLLMLLPTPDFSMTFNVSALTGSLVSVLAITIIRKLIERVAWKDYKPGKSSESRKASLLKHAFSRLLRK